MIYDQIRHRELGKTTALNHQAREEIEKRVCALDIPSRTEADGRNCTRLHTIGGRVILMNFTIRTEQSTTMLFVSKFVAEDDPARAVLCRNAIRNGKVIEPHDHIVE